MWTSTRPTYKTDPRKRHILHVVADTGSWEQKMAQVLEEMGEVVCYVKNRCGALPSPEPNGVRQGDGAGGEGEMLNLILEISGEPRKDKAVKVAMARSLWVPAVNNYGVFGRWAFLEISDPWDAQNTIKTFLSSTLRDEQ